MFRWALIVTACTGLTACISVTAPPSQSSSNPVFQDSASEIAELRGEIRSLRDSMAKGDQSVPNPSQRDGNGIDYASVQELLRSTSKVASMPNVTFTKPDEYSEYNILQYRVYEGENAGANGLAFIERGYGSRFKEYRDLYAESCRDDGNEFFEIGQGADSEGDYGTMNYVYACLSRNKNLQKIGRSETLFVLDGGYGIGYTEMVAYPLSYRDAQKIVRETRQTY